MLTVLEQTIPVLQAIVQGVPLGTNLALLQLIWAIMNGSFLDSRGAIFGALALNKFGEDEVRRAWRALRHGVWQIDGLIGHWRGYVEREHVWQAHSYEGYRPLAVDWTSFWRFGLQGWTGKFFHAIAGRALRGIGFGLVSDIGQIDEQRIPLLRKIIRSRWRNPSEAQLKKDTLQWVTRHLGEQQVVIVDGGVKIPQLQTLAVARYVVRLANNCTGRRNYPAPYKGWGRYPVWGERVRPLARTYKGNSIAASAADIVTDFAFEGRTIRAHGWKNMVHSDLKPDPHNPTFAIWVLFDPLYDDPMILGTNLQDAQPSTILCLYLDRWPVEQLPLIAKQMLGLHRQFVFAPQSCFRLPELALLVGNILTYLAAILAPMPTGFWDRRPRKTPGRLRRRLRKVVFPKQAFSDPRIRKKNSVTDHLPKGVAAHRRQKQVA